MTNYTHFLPPEIWIHTFKLAAAEPFALINTSPVPPATDGQRAWSDRATSRFRSLHNSAYDKRLKTRCALVLVNKYFHRLAIGVLYEYIILQRAKPLFLFSQTLRNDWHRSKRLGAVANLAQSVKCLNLNLFMYGQGIPGLDNRREIDQSFLAPFELLTNLEILSIGGEKSPLCAEVQCIVMREILKNGCRLRYINCCGEPGGFENFPVAEIFQYQFATLEVLCVALMAAPGSSYPYFFSNLPSYTLPRLHTLDINSNLRSNILEWMSGWDLPSLQSCRLPVIAKSSMAVSCLSSKSMGKILQLWTLINP